MTPLSGSSAGLANPNRTDDPADQILLTVLAEIEVFAEVDATLADGPDGYIVAFRTKGVAYRPDAWFGGPLSGAQRKTYSRALKRLERIGLLRRITGPRDCRTTHVQLTAAGLDRALQLAGSGANRFAVAEGLRRTAWGKDLPVETGGSGPPGEARRGRAPRVSPSNETFLTRRYPVSQKGTPS